MDSVILRGFLKLKSINACCVSGPGPSDSQSTKPNKRQEETLRRFRYKDYNVLICTSFLETGVDLPRCNLVMRFNLPENYQSYVQAKVGKKKRALNIYIYTK